MLLRILQSARYCVAEVNSDPNQGIGKYVGARLRSTQRWLWSLLRIQFRLRLPLLAQDCFELLGHSRAILVSDGSVARKSGLCANFQIGRFLLRNRFPGRRLSRQGSSLPCLERHRFQEHWDRHFQRPKGVQAICDLSVFLLEAFLFGDPALQGSRSFFDGMARRSIGDKPFSLQKRLFRLFDILVSGGLVEGGGSDLESFRILVILYLTICDIADYQENDQRPMPEWRILGPVYGWLQKELF